MSNIKAKIKNKIDNLSDGAVFISNDFLEIADYETVRKTLNRFVNEGTIQRVVNGVYYKPRYIELIGEYESPSINEVAIAIARKYNWTIAPSGNTALNLLGLSTQVPAQWTYISDGRYVDFLIGNTKLVFKRTTNSTISNMSQLTALVIQAIKAIGKDNISEEQILYLKKRLTKSDKEKLLEEGKTTSAWIYKILKKIGES
ncbi:DUF6088 family protein [Streptococcus suis]|uniref:DUF6088 family protein n=1 Tax=Streptococcus suis TaxID=1307 RepID=UPI000462AA78|nr:DUF6088 family protein [Streptococcus suis]ANC99808.1 hypothetical protein A6M16_04630 [Streptococcus suis]AOM74528.1 hypothetical protein BFP66_04520 [Streptococcus suis]MBL6514634.1 hypothetical protein [Streptococcus suis]MBS8058060.1 hypothetical protein [Streptococcus suis]MBS8113602.1 hypothetical protein [Streptococcus suis]